MAIAIALLAAACGDGGATAPDAAVLPSLGACTALEGKVYTTPNELECGLTPTGVGLCPWTLTFEAMTATESIVRWGHSDVGETLRVTCEDAVLTAERGYTGRYDPGTDSVMWEGETYLGPR